MNKYQIYSTSKQIYQHYIIKEYLPKKNLGGDSQGGRLWEHGSEKLPVY